GPPQHHAHGAIYRASLRPLRWVLEGLRERMSDEPTPRASAADVGAWGVSRRASLAAPERPQQQSEIGWKTSNLAGRRYVLRGHPKAATGHPDRADRRRCHR